MQETGMELGNADDKIFGRSDSKKKDGTVGILTGWVVCGWVGVCMCAHEGVGSEWLHAHERVFVRVWPVCAPGPNPDPGPDPNSPTRNPTGV